MQGRNELTKSERRKSFLLIYASCRLRTDRHNLLKERHRKSMRLAGRSFAWGGNYLLVALQGVCRRYV